MKQIIMNYLFIFGLPLIVGFTVRVLLNHFRMAYLTTVAFGIAALIDWCILQTNPTPGSELFWILTMHAACAFAASLLTGTVCRLIRKKPSK